MAQRVPEGLHDDDYKFLKVWKMMQSEIRTSLFTIFTTACPKLPTQLLKDYLTSAPLNMSNGTFKKKFNASQRDTLDRDSSGNTFDISLLSAAIEVSCQGLSPELEDLVKRNKNFRNDLLHEDQNIDLLSKSQEIVDLVKETYLEIDKCYPGKVDVTDEINKMQNNIDNIRNVPLPDRDIVKYRQDVKTLRNNLKEDFKKKGQKELMEKADTMRMIDPVSFISGSQQTFRVKEIYTPINLVVDKSRGKKDDIPVQCEDLLTDLEQNGTNPNVVILEGPSGSGKTTLTKLMHSDWVTGLEGGTCSFKNIDEFDLVFPYECSNANLSSYKDLISYLLPETISWFRNDEDILRSARELRILILIDAADDLHVNSKKLLKELIETRIPESAGKLRLVCTTRPQAFRNLLAMIPNTLTKVHTKIMGIPSHRRKEFVTRLHDELKIKGHSTQDTNELVKYLEKSQAYMGEHFKLPLILTLLTYLWANDPDEVNDTTTVTGLYISIHNLIQDRLVHRLFNLNKERSIDMDIEEIENRCSEFLKILYKESLFSICHGAMVLPDKCAQKLKNAADQQGLPNNEMFAAFLSLDRKWTARGYKYQLAAPHKSHLEFFAASFIVEVMSQQIKTDHQLDLESQLNNGSLDDAEKKRIEEEIIKTRTIDRVLKTIHREIGTPLEMSKYHDLLVHVMGLLTCKGKLHQFHVEVVEQMKQTGEHNDGSYWFQVINEAKINTEVSKTIANKMEENDRQQWVISDNNIAAAIELMKTVVPRKVDIKLYTNSTNIKELCIKFMKTKCVVTLNDKFSWRNNQQYVNDYLPLISRCVVKTLTTTVNDVKVLPTTVEVLSLGIPSIDGEAVDPGFNQLTTQCPGLRSLRIHLRGGTGITRLPQLPDVEYTLLFVSQVQDVAWLVETAVKLQPPSGYSLLVLPTCQVSGEEVMTLPAALSEAGVKVRVYVLLASPHTAEQDTQMEAACDEALGCSCGWVDNDDQLRPFGW